MARRRYQIDRLQHQMNYLSLYYNHNAVTIQRYYKGYNVRKYICNIAARHEYIAETSAAGEKLLTEAKLYNHQSIQYTQSINHTTHQHHINSITNNIHHLLSTTSQPGVFNHPYNGFVQLDNGITVEQQIQQSFTHKQQQLKRIRSNLTHPINPLLSTGNYRSSHQPYKHQSISSQLTNKRVNILPHKHKQPTTVKLPVITAHRTVIT